MRTGDVGSGAGRRELHVLNLSPVTESSFYRSQLASLSQRNVHGDTVPVPGEAGGGESRSPVDYLRYVPLVRRAVGDDYDLLHANYGLTAPHGLAQARLPTVLTLWGTDLYGPFGWLSRACAPLFDAVIVMSERMRERLPCGCTVIPHGVDLEVFTPEPRARARARLGWDVDASYVLFPASADRPEKGYPRAERIVEVARRRTDGPVQLETLDGSVPHGEVPTVMNASDALLLTSRYEGSPNAVKEALACNLPVVSTDVGDVAERLDGVEPSATGTTDGELVDALVAVLRRRERSNGRDAVRDLGLERTAERIRAVYERVLLEAGEPPEDRGNITIDGPTEGGT